MSEIENIYTEISEVAVLLHNNGWAEKNAGNFSVKLNSQIIANENELANITGDYSNLCNCEFVFSGKGRRMRDIACNPAHNTVILKINSTGTAYSYIKDNGIVPTSELYTHLAIHNMIAKRGSNEKVVMHSHVTELIAITQFEEFCNQDMLNSILLKMHPETIMFIPKGIGFVDFAMPGSQEIAAATIESLKKHTIAIWEKHGVFGIAPSLNDCYDLIDIVAKSAKIYFMCAQTGVLPKGLTDAQLEELKKIKF